VNYEWYVLSKTLASLYSKRLSHRDAPPFDLPLDGYCFLSGVGQAAGWIYPMSTLMEQGEMDIAECNVPVKSADAFFGGLCAPDALARYYNPFGKFYVVFENVFCELN
jgi:hypothetical protein